MQVKDNRRQAAGPVAPEHEDSGLFHAPPIQETLLATPVYSRNQRRDIIILALIEHSGRPPREVELLFAGRRKGAAGPLKARLDTLLHRARTKADRAGQPLPPATEVRLPIKALGSWRARTDDSQDDWREVRYQFAVAKWTMASEDADPPLFGEWPIGTWETD